MKKLIRPSLIIGLSLFLALFSTATTYSTQSATLPDLSDASLFFQTTPTPQVIDKSEIGSTDEIVIMSGVIIFIIFFPILLTRKSWR
jgi:hypothetical protein